MLCNDVTWEFSDVNCVSRKEIAESYVSTSTYDSVSKADEARETLNKSADMR